MTSLVIESAANPRLKRLKKLMTSSRARRDEGVFLAEGAHLGLAMREAGLKPLAIYVRQGDLSREVANLVKAFNAPTWIMKASAFESVSGLEKGSEIIFEVKREAAIKPTAPVDAVYLDGLQDAGNAGTILRSALASGIRFVAASTSTVDLFSPKVLRSAMGAHFGMKIFENVKATELKPLFAAKILAAEAKGGTSIYEDGNWAKGATVLILGNEGNGVSDAALAVSEQKLYIPITRDVESLNVSAAAAVLFFEQMRLRNTYGRL